MIRFNAIDYIAHILVIIGAINWGLIGFANYDLVGALFGGMSSLVSRSIFALVGFMLSALCSAVAISTQLLVIIPAPMI